jgi:hypothetical protein
MAVTQTIVATNWKPTCDSGDVAIMFTCTILWYYKLTELPCSPVILEPENIQSIARRVWGAFISGTLLLK